MAWERHQRVGTYRLLSEIGSGRSCKVWEAIDDTTQERRAIKITDEHVSADKEQLALMKQEFAVGQGLDHPQIIHIYDFKSVRGAYYLVMELFPAQNIKQFFLQEGLEGIAPYMPKIVEQSVAGLGYLHSQGWIHRDVKPDNFLMNRQGAVKLIDFAITDRKKGGLAALFSGRGKVQGTRSYMSPEQIRGKGVDERSDIYGLGCMFHELISGKPPFTGQTTQELLTKHLQSPAPSLESAGRDVTSEFAELVRKMLAKKPENRPQSMSDIQLVLRSMQVFNRIPSPPGAAKTRTE